MIPTTLARTALRRVTRSLTLAAALLAGCGGDNPTEPASITIASSASTATAAQGASASATISVARTNFSGDVTLSSSGAPAGVTVTFAPPALGASTTQSVATFAVGVTAVPGAYPITITAAGAGITARSTIVTLTIPQPPAAYTLTLASSAVSVGAGGTTTLGVTLARTNFTGAVTLAVAGLPAGATASFNPAAPTADASTLTINAGSAAAGTYNLTVTGTAAGLTDRTAAVTLTISNSAYTLTLASTAVTVQQAASTTVDVTLARTNYIGSVQLAASGVPAGATVTFAPSATTGSTSVMTVSAGTAAAGTYTVTVTGTAVGMADRTTTFTLTVTATPGFTLSLASSSMAVNAGASGSVAVEVMRTNFTGDVTFSLAGLPAGATASFSPNPSSLSTALTIASGTAAPGTYALTVTGAATGMTPRTGALSLVITPAGGTSVSFAFCADELPTWVAYQSGTGAWQRASVGTNNTYSFPITARGGVAIVNPAAGSAMLYGYETTVFYGTASELQSLGSTYCVPFATGTRRVNGSVAGSGGGLYSVVLGEAQFTGIGDGSFTMNNAPNAAADLLATLNSAASGSLSRMIIRRSQNPADNATLPVLDFGAAEAFTPTVNTLTLTGVTGSVPVYIGSTFLSANGSVADLEFDQRTAGAATFRGVPSTIAGDLHEVLLQTGELTGSRGAFAYYAASGNRTLALGPVLSTIAVSSLGTTPYPRPRLQFQSQAEYGTAVNVVFNQGGASPAASDRLVQIVATRDYFGGLPATWDVGVPDFSGASGFSNSWMLQSGAFTETLAVAYGGDILTAMPADGSRILFAQSPVATFTAALTAEPVRSRLSPTPRSAMRIKADAARMTRIAHNRRLMRRGGTGR